MNSEVISACENVCRDFSWLPKLLAVLADLGTFLIGLGAIAAFKQLSVWRTQVKTLARADVAKSVLVSVYEVDEALRFIRNPLDSIPIEKANEKGITYIRRNERLQQTNEDFQKLRKAQIDQDIVLGLSRVSTAIDELFKIRTEIRLAIEFLYEALDEQDFDRDTRELKLEWRRTMSGSYSERDEVGKRQIEAVKNIKDELAEIAQLTK